MLSTAALELFIFTNHAVKQKITTTNYLSQFDLEIPQRQDKKSKLK